MQRPLDKRLNMLAVGDEIMVPCKIIGIDAPHGDEGEPIVRCRPIVTGPFGPYVFMARQVELMDAPTPHQQSQDREQAQRHRADELGQAAAIGINGGGVRLPMHLSDVAIVSPAPIVGQMVHVRPVDVLAPHYSPRTTDAAHGVDDIEDVEEIADALRELDDATAEDASFRL